LSDIYIPNKEIILPYDYKVFSKPEDYTMSQRKLERYEQIAKIKSYYQRNPIKFMRDVLGAELFDAQAYCIQMSWNKPYVLWVCSRGYGKSTIVDLILMTKGMLYNNYWSYIASGSGDQAILTFKTLENIANQNIASMTGLTDVFKQQLEVKNAAGDGFVHNPSGHFYSLYNGSFTKTLNSNVDKRRGARANMVVFDECGWLDQNMMQVYAAFTIVNKDLKLGGNIDGETIKSIPKEVPNQLFYISSASSIDTPFYEKYRDFSKQMILGNKDYFVADINCDVVIKGTVGGKIYPASLLTQETVDAEMRNNPEKAQREYYNRFTEDGGVNQIIKRALIARNSYVRPPVLHNDTNKRKFVLAYDPARSSDNSILGIGELKYDELVGYTLDIVNCVSFMDIGLKRKTPMMTQDQIKEIKKILLDYNGDVLDYDNIEIMLADAGSGGGGSSWVRDALIEDWVDSNGKTHRGLIDKEYAPEYAGRYPNAIDKLKLIEPSKYKSEMFESLIKMVEANLITWTDTYDNRGYLSINEVDQTALKRNKITIMNQLEQENLSQKDFEDKLEEALSEVDVSKYKIYKLTPDEEIALKQIDMMKEEIVNICRTKRESGKDMFKLPPHKDADTGASEATMHDDRAYVLAMLGWYLSEKRLEHIRTRKAHTTEELAEFFDFKTPRSSHSYFR
jgi:hypothetical protein